MITLLGSLLGFFSSAFPDFMRTYRDQKDRQHELHILDRQIEMAKSGHTQRLEEIQTQAQATMTAGLYQHAQPTGVGWVDALSGTVRPVITYAFFFLYGSVKISQWMTVQAILSSHNWAEALVRVWDMEDQTLFATVISFWFGQRLLMKTKQQK